MDAAQLNGDIETVLGTRLRALRLEMGMSQMEFSEAIGFAQTSLSGLERGLNWGGLARLWNGLRRAGAQPLRLFLPDVSDNRVAEALDLLPQLSDVQLNVVLGMMRELAKTE